MADKLGNEVRIELGQLNPSCQSHLLIWHGNTLEFGRSFLFNFKKSRHTLILTRVILSLHSDILESALLIFGRHHLTWKLKEGHLYSGVYMYISLITLKT